MLPLLLLLAQATTESPAYYNDRGEENFRTGRIAESIADFDKAIALEPRLAPQHWQRGVALYYANRFADGRKQFELHQTVNPSDVENAVWHFLCVARLEGAEKARASLIPIPEDTRVPMMQIHALFAGKGPVDDVLKQATSRDALFYAHLYLGLYYEVIGNAELSKKHIQLAAHDYAMDHYMGDVARVHEKLRSRSGR
jgi:lipoprotein NlpI